MAGVSSVKGIVRAVFLCGGFPAVGWVAVSGGNRRCRRGFQKRGSVGCGPRRPTDDTASRAAISSPDMTKSKMSAFSRMRAGDTDQGVVLQTPAYENLCLGFAVFFGDCFQDGIAESATAAQRCPRFHDYSVDTGEVGGFRLVRVGETEVIFYLIDHRRHLTFV